MKVNKLAAVAICVQAGFAIPHGKHEDLHKRAAVTVHSTVTNVVTVTDYNAIVWVDLAGNVVKTEFKSPATTTSTLVASTLAASTTSTSSTKSVNTSKPDSSTGSSKSDSEEEDRRLQRTRSSVYNSPTPIPNSPNAGTVKNPESTAGANTIKAAANIGGFGVAYDAYSGSGSSCRSSLYDDFGFLASKGARSIRVYDVCFGEAVNAAAAHGLRLMVGITNYDNFDNHLYALADTVAATKAGWSVVDSVFIGNEMSTKGISPSAIADKVNYGRSLLKSKGWNGAVVTVDVWVNIRDNPVICSTSDFCAANAHAYFDGGVTAAGAGDFVRLAQSSVAAKVGGKHVVITESGWPHAGATNGKAIADVANQRLAMSSITASFSANPGDVYLFMAYDTKWKTGAEVERNFGIFDADHYNGTP